MTQHNGGFYMTKGRLPVLNELYTNLKKERQLYNFFS